MIVFGNFFSEYLFSVILTNITIHTRRAFEPTTLYGRVRKALDFKSLLIAYLLDDFVPNVFHGVGCHKLQKLITNRSIASGFVFIDVSAVTWEFSLLPSSINSCLQVGFVFQQRDELSFKWITKA